MRPKPLYTEKSGPNGLFAGARAPSVLLEPAPQEALQREPRTRGVTLGSGVSLVKSTIK